MEKGYQNCPHCCGTGLEPSGTFNTALPKCSVCGGYKIISTFNGFPPCSPESKQPAPTEGEIIDAVEFADFLLGDFEMDVLSDKQTLCWRLAGTQQKYTTAQAYESFKTTLKRQ